MAWLHLENVVKEYTSKAEALRILDNLSLSVTDENIISITGESGSGKSTLLNLIAGIDSVSSGEISVLDFPVTEKNENQLNKYRNSMIGLVFQFHYLLNDFNALENIMIPAMMAGDPKKKAKEKSYQLLEDVGLEDRSDHFPGELSGGERQRIAFARALVNDPPLILADEPTGNLDEKNSDHLAEIMFGLVEKKGRRFILVTHDKQLAARTEKQFILSSGVLLEHSGSEHE